MKTIFKIGFEAQYRRLSSWEAYLQNLFENFNKKLELCQYRVENQVC